jgi:hypothetical protein
LHRSSHRRISAGFVTGTRSVSSVASRDATATAGAGLRPAPATFAGILIRSGFVTPVFLKNAKNETGQPTYFLLRASYLSESGRGIRQHVRSVHFNFAAVGTRVCI